MEVVPHSRSRLEPEIGTLSRRAQIGLATVLVGLGFLYAPTLWWLLGRWTQGVWSQNVHGMLVPLVVTYVAWQKLRDTSRWPRSASPLGFLFLGPALLLHAVDAGLHTQLLSAISTILALPGLSLVFLGIERTKRIALLFPFLLFMLPLPFAVTERIYLMLREIATTGSSSVVELLGIPVFTEGTTIHLAGASLQVVNACSGFGTLYAATAVACMTAYMSESRWRRVLVLTLAPVLAIAANVLRVAILALLVVWQGTDILDTSVHTISGMMTFALALPVILWAGTDSREAGRQRD